MYSVGFYTLGCKVSQYETEAVAELFSDNGFSPSPFENKNDVYVINTCTVTAESDRKCRQLIRRATKNNPEAIVMVMGCYSQRAPEEVSKIPGVCAVIGTENKLSLVEIAKRMLSEREECGRVTQYVSVTDVKCASFERMRVRSAPRTRAYVKIEDGCESKCTYCAIAAARGRVRSKAVSDVVEEVEALSASGVREIVLTGIETASYGRDLEEKITLADLLVLLDKRGSCERIRLGSLAPELIDDAFIEKVSGLKILAPHFHLSLQSGSDAVLRRMKRRYNSARAKSVIDKLREKIDGVTFTTDLMVGFPGESEEEFLDTVRFVREARFLDAHVFAYSRREGTEAAYFDGQIPEEIKKERSARLIKIKNEVRDSLLLDFLNKGRALSAVVESISEDGFYVAHSDSYVEIKFKSECDSLIGKIVDLVPVSHKDGILYCRL